MYSRQVFTFFISLILFPISFSFLDNFRDICCHNGTEKAQKSKLR